MKWSLPAMLVAFLLAACQTGTARPGRMPATAPAPSGGEWQRTAATEDLDRIARIGAAWADGLAAARADGFGRRIAAEGELLHPQSALPRPAPTPGAYLCRLVRLGSARRGEPGLVAFRPFYCFVGVDGDGNRLSITKSEGSARPAGYLWDDPNGRRLIFLGALAPATGPVPAYGDDRARDIAGILERIGPFRWRLVIPRPAGGAAIEIFEMEPAQAQE